MPIPTKKRIWRFNQILCLIAFLLFPIVSLSTASAQDDEEKVPVRHLAAPDSCIAFASWNGWGDFRPNGSPTEKWMSQPEISDGFKKVKKELIAMIENNNQGREKDVIQFQVALFRVFYALIENEGFFYITEIEPGEETEVKFHLSLSLKDYFESTLEANKYVVKELGNQPNFQLEKEKFGSRVFHSVKLPRIKNRIYWSISKGKLEIVSSESMLRTWKLNKKTEQPDWLAKTKKHHKLKRLRSVTYVNIASLLETYLGPEPPEFAVKLGLDHLTNLTVVGGINKNGSVVKGQLKCNSSDVPILNFLSSHGFSAKNFQHIKKSDTYLAAVKIENAKVLELIDTVCEIAGQRNEITEGFIRADAEGVDVQQLIESIGPNYIFSGKFVLPNPLLGLGLSANINDSAAFEKQAENVVELIKKNTKGLPEQVRPTFEEKKGIRYLTVPIDGTQKVVIAYNKKRIVVSANQRKARQFLSTKPAATPIRSIPTVKNLFDSKFQADGRPVFLAVADPTPGIEVGYPLLQTLAPPSKTIPGTELSTKDLPPLEVLIKDWQPIVAAAYRTNYGIDFSLQTTTPILPPPVFLGVSSGVILPGVQSARVSARRTASMNNLRQILLAMHVFHDSKNHFPARYSTNKNGKPLLSWRVHILPYLQEEELYKKFRLNEPWNSPHNKKLISEMPLTFRSPNLALRPGKTAYLGVVGEGAGLIKAKKNGSANGSRMADFRDGTSNTIIVIEAGENDAVTWTAPDDFDFSKKGADKKLSKIRPDKTFLAGFADGSVRLFSSSFEWKELKRYFTHKGND